MKKYSHNSYWCKDPIISALREGLNAVEADIIFVGGKIMCSHGWRPFKSWCHGSLEEVFLKPLLDLAESGKEMVLIIEPKSIRKGMMKKLYNLLHYYAHYNLKLIIGCQYKLFWQHKRLVWLYDFNLMCKKYGWAVEIPDKRLYTEYHKQVDLFPEYGFIKRILKNQF